jgi:predicted nucleic acid-binding protein
MLLVVDANVVFSALVNKGETYQVFENNKKWKKFIFIAPEYMFSEIEKKITKLLSVTSLTTDELQDAFIFIREQIETISFSEFSDMLPEAQKRNLNDAPYIALALKRRCPIFSGDKQLKQQAKIPVYSPREILNILSRE